MGAFNIHTCTDPSINIETSVICTDVPRQKHRQKVLQEKKILDLPKSFLFYKEDSIVN